MFLPAEPIEQLGDAGFGLPYGEIAEVPDVIFACYDGIPAFDHCRVHRRDRSEWPPVERQRARMPEMRVTGEEDRHGHEFPAAAAVLRYLRVRHYNERGDRFPLAFVTQ